MPRFIRHFLIRVLPAALIFLCPAVLPLSPKEAASYNEKGVEAMRSGDFRGAIEYFRTAAKHLPDNDIVKNNLSNAYNNYGLSLLKKGQSLNAIDNFRASLRHNPSNVYAMVDMAQAYYAMNDLKNAAVFLEKALRQSPDMPNLKEFYDKIKGEISVESRLSRSGTAHFEIIAEAGADANMIDDIGIMAEDAYSRVGSFLNYYPRAKATVILFPENAYSSISSGKPDWAHAIFDGKIRIPVPGARYSRSYLKRIIYHEFSHLVVRDLSQRKCPLWLSEGIACYAESLAEPKPVDFLTSFINRESFRPFSTFPSDYGEISGIVEANLLYREFFMAVSFIMDRYGNTILRNMLLGYAQGKSTARVVKDDIYIGMDEFDGKYSEYVFGKLGM